MRAGELFIGSEEEPFTGNAEITLHGMQDEETFILGQAISAGNKILANVGDVKMYGQPRDRHTRLLEPVRAEESIILVE